MSSTIPPTFQEQQHRWRFDTRQVHAGQVPDPTTGARAVPIYQTTSFAFRDTQHASDLFSLAEVGNIYTRVYNPTSGVVEERIADLEGGTAAVAVASGQAAETLALLSLARAGDHIVSAAPIYGGTYNLLAHGLADLGIEVSFIDDPDNLSAWRAAIRPNTKAFFAESITNPRSSILDIDGVARVAHQAGVPLVVDNTTATPFLIRPLEWGADVVVHSATKYLGGHGTVIAGVVVDGGTFDFGAQPERWPQFHRPDPSYHGLVFWDTFSPDRVAYATLLRTKLLRDHGPSLSPFNAFLLLQGLETLSLRMSRHVDNARQLAQWLNVRPEVSAVWYSGLPTSPWYAAAQAYAPLGPGAIVSFEVAGGVDAGRALIDAVQLFSHLVNIGDVRSLIAHPASTTHAQLTEEQQLASGVTPGLVRLAVGIEGIADLKADLEVGLAAAAAKARKAAVPAE